MFRKVHVRLAALCAGITIFILLVMSCGFLYISERGLRTSSFAAFQNDMDALITSLEQQTIITHEWLSRIEDNGTYLINVIDNGVPFLYNERNTPEQKRLFSAAWETCNSRLEVEPLLSAFDTWHMEYPFSSSGGTRNDYYACVITSQRNTGTFQVMVLCSMEPLLSQIRTQRLLFLGLNLLASAALALFSWYFTRQLLRPLEENQRQQN